MNSAIRSYLKYRLPKSELHYLLLNKFKISAEYHDCLGKYYLLYWTGTHLRASVHNGTVTHQERTYQCIFQNCTPELAYRSEQVVLSFREARVEFGLPAYVLVRTCTERA